MWHVSPGEWAWALLGPGLSQGKQCLGCDCVPDPAVSSCEVGAGG